MFSLLSRIIKILKNIWQSFFKPPTPEPASEQKEVPKPYKPLSDADYEYLFEQLLEGIAYGWQPGRIQRFFETLGDRGEKEAWLSWLERYELRAMTAPASNESLARQLIKLGEQSQALSETSTARRVGDRAHSIGIRLLSRGTLNEIWEYSGPDASATVSPSAAATESLLPPPPAAPTVEAIPQTATPQTPLPPPLNLNAPDVSWEELLASLQQNPDFAAQVARELGLETTNLQSIAAAIAEQIEQQQTTPTAEDAETWFNRGVERYEIEDYAAALSYWEKAIELRPDYYQAWNNRGLALKQLGRAEEGLSCYRRALELEPNYYKAWYNQGIVLEELERFDAAIASYDKALELKPDYDKAWSSRGDALKAKADYAAAIASYDRALELKADLAEVWYQRGLALKPLGRARDAIASYDKALELRAESPQIWTARGLALVEIESYEEAIASFDRALQFKSEAWDAWLHRSRAARLSAAPDLLLTSLSAIANSSPTLNQRGEAGELASLEAGLERLYPNAHPEGWGRLHAAIGRICARQGRDCAQPQELWRKAVSRYHEALTTLTEEAFPELHLDVLQDLIQVQWALAETARANKLLQRGASLLLRLLDDPQQSEAQQKHRAAELARFNQLGVDLAIQSGELIAALELAEQGKLATLSPMPDQPLEPIGWAQIQHQLAPQTAAIYWHESPVALTTFILRGDRAEPIVLGQPGNEVKSIVLTPSLRSRIKEARDNPAQLGQIFLELLDLDGSDPSTAAHPASSSPDAMQRLQQFESWLERWQQTLSQPESREATLPELLNPLGDLLAIPAILQAIAIEALTPPQTLLLIPCGKLLSLPLPALFGLAGDAPGQSMLSDVTLRCLPSARIAFRNSPEVQPQSLSILLVAPPETETALDSALAGSYFAQSRLLDPSQTTKADAIAALSGGYQILHASDVLTNSDKYAVEFQDGESFALEGLCALSLSSYFLIALPPGGTDTAELAGKLLARGVNYVLRRLWPGDATANFLLTSEFYRRLAAGTQPPEALQQSQSWLRTATAPAFVQWYRDRAAEIPDETRAARLERQARSLEENPATMDSDCPPYANPYYWAGFMVMG